MRLTKDQSNLVEDNHSLIYGYARDYGLDIDEWYGALAIELCNAAAVHDVYKGSLSTLFYRMATNMMNSYYRSEGAFKRQDGGMLSLDYEHYSDDGSPVTLEDLIQPVGTESVEDMLILEEKVDNLLEGEYGDIIQLRMDGYSQEEIGRQLGMTQQNVSLVLQELREEFD